MKLRLAFCFLAASLFSVSCGKEDEKEAKAYSGVSGNCVQAFSDAALASSGICHDWSYSGTVKEDPAATALQTSKSACEATTTMTAVWTDGKACDAAKTGVAKGKCVLVTTGKEDGETFTVTNTMYFYGDAYSDPTQFAVAKAACVSSEGTTATWTALVEPLPEIALDGTWETDCVAEEEDGETSYEKNIFSVAGSSLTQTSMDFGSSSTCAAEELKYSMVLTGTFTVGTAASAPADFRKFNIVVTDVTVEPNSAEVAAMLNQISLFGITDWAASTATSVAGKSPTPDAPAKEKAPGVGDTVYDILKATATTVQFGENTDDLDGSAEAKRPSAAESFSYTKQ